MGIAIGLDFGTINSVVSYIDAAGGLETFRQNGSPLIPSAIFFKDDGDYLIGQAAVSSGEKFPDAQISGFKTKLNDGGDFILAGKKLKPKFATKIFLNRLMAQVQEELIKKFGAAEGLIDRAVIAVPAKFSDAANRAIKNAAAAAMNLSANQIKLVYEPTAAAVAAQRENFSGASNFLIYDLGGGSFEVSLIQHSFGVFRQIATGGDANCGGEFLTQLLAQYLWILANDEFATDFPWDDSDFDEDFHELSEFQYAQNRRVILKAAENLKISLSSEFSVTAAFPFYVSENLSRNFNAEISRAVFEELIFETVSHTAEIARRVASSDKVDKIIMAGGSSQIPLVRKVLRDNFPNLDVNYSAEVSTLISRGAAILAQNIDSLESKIAHKTAVELGVASTAGLQYNIFRALIAAGVDIPCENSCEFKLLEDNQRRLEIACYERDVQNFPRARRIDDDGIRLVDVLQIDLPAGLKKSATRVKVTFRVENDAGLNFSAAVTSIDGVDIGGGNLQIRRASDLF